MNVLWIDTETTGLDPKDSGAFELAMMLYISGTYSCERVFHLNPLSDTILYHSGSFLAHGITEEEIKSYPPASKIVSNIANFLSQCVTLMGSEKLVFAGYNCKFDYDHLSVLLERYGFKMTDYFDGRMIDVYKLVKKATTDRKIERTENQKLGTICKALKVSLENAHTALADIKATREVCVKLFKMGVKV